MSKWLDLGNDRKLGGYLFGADECVLKYHGISIPPSFQESDQVSENSRVWLRDYDTIVSSPKATERTEKIENQRTQRTWASKRSLSKSADKKVISKKRGESKMVNGKVR